MRLLPLVLLIGLVCACDSKSSSDAGVDGLADADAGQDPDGDAGTSDDQPAGHTAEILRDTWGVPHIFGTTAEAVFYAFGQAQAEDHLPLMSVFYLEINGELSQTFSGDIPVTVATETFDDLLRSDRTVRLLRIRTDVVDGWEQVNAEDDPNWSFTTSSLIEAFAAGINDWVAAHPEVRERHPWIPTFTAQGILTLGRFPNVGRQFSVIVDKVGRLRVPASAAAHIGFLPLAAGEWEWGESNSFVLGPSRTDNGSVRVLASPHLPFFGHNIWYEAHLSGGGFDVAGAGFYGSPVISLGHNRHLAWASTNNSADNADLFFLLVNPDDPTRYLVDGAPQNFSFSSETVTLAGGGSHTFETAFADVGGFSCPVVAGLPPGSVDPADAIGVGDNDFSAIGSVVVACLTTIGDPFIGTQYLKMIRAESTQAFREAMQSLHSVRWNYVVGDSGGHIYYLCNSRHPLRPQSVLTSGEYLLAIDGSSSAKHWQGLLPFDELPQAEDPSSGFFQNCNNSPAWVTPTFNNPIDMTDYPVDLCSPGNPSSTGQRSRRMLDLLSESTSHSFTGLEAVASDAYLLYAEAYVPELVTWAGALGGQTSDPAALDRGVAILQDWDFVASAESTETVLFTRWAKAIQTTLGSLPYPVPGNLTEPERIAALDLLATSVLDLEASQGTAEVVYGDLHRIRRGTVDLPVGGSQGFLQALFLVDSRVVENDVGYAWSGASYHMLTEIGPEGVTSVSTKPWGQSDDPDSPHYADLTEVFARSEHKPFWFDRADIEANLESLTEVEYIP